MRKNENLTRDYFYQAARDNGISVKEYLNNADKNYVITEEGVVIKWRENNCPVIFGDIKDAIGELAQWCETFHNVSIITEKEMLEIYCKAEYEKALADIKEDEEERVMDSLNGHDAELVGRINHAWRKNKEMFYPILCALYKRDIDEITDADSFQIDMWCPENGDGCREEIKLAYIHGKITNDWTRYNELALEDMIREWDFFATNYLEHIADDCDLECILNFLHYPLLPIYADL